MAVSKTQDWAAITTTEPAGTVTIGSGTNRVLIFVDGYEYDEDASVGSTEIGGQSAPYSGKLYFDLGGTNNIGIRYWAWDEAALGAMSGNSISYVDNASTVMSKVGFTYATFASCDQTTPLVVNSSSGSSVNTLGVPCVGTSGDYVAVVGTRDSGNRKFNSWGNLTEIIDGTIGAARIGVGDGAWAANSETITGDGISDSMLLRSFVIKQLSGSPSGAGSVTAPAATFSGSGDIGVNDLKAPVVTFTGVGERVIVWIGSTVELTAPQPVSVSTSATQNPDSFAGPVEFSPPFPEMFGTGEREIVGPGALSCPVAISSGVGAHGYIGTGALSAPLAQAAGDTNFDALWYVTKTVYF